MAENNLALAISAIVISYQSAKDLMYSIRLLENHWGRGADIVSKENALLDALIAGENQVSSRYAAIYKELGEKYRKADGDCHNKLSRIAQLIELKIVGNLQTAVSSSTIPRDYQKITHDAEIFRRAALGVLEERRLLFQKKPVYERPMQMNAPVTADDKSSIYSTDAPAAAPTDTFIHEIEAPRLEPDPQPSVEFLPVSEWSDDESTSPITATKSRMSRLFLHRRAKKQREHKELPTTPAQLTLLKHFDWHGSGLHNAPADKTKGRGSGKTRYTSEDVPVMLEIPVRTTSKRDSTTLGSWDKWRSQDRPSTSCGGGYDSFTLAKAESLVRSGSLKKPESASTSDLRLSIVTRSRSSTNGSGTPATTPSDTSSAMWNLSPRSVASSVESRSSTEDVPPIPVKNPRRVNLMNARPSHQRTTTMSTMESLPERVRPSVHFEEQERVRTAIQFEPDLLLPDPQGELEPVHPAYKSAPAPTSHPSSLALTRSITPTPSVVPSISSSEPSFTAIPEIALLAPPSKKNNYWGFCKGTWEIRENPNKGLKIQTRPSGVYNTVSAFQCRHCNFQSDVCSKKPFTIDNKVYTADGVMYRWLFLAKSHVKCKVTSDFLGGPTGGSQEYSYGCMFCCEKGRGTGVFGNVETLMAHIVAEHGGMMKSEDVQKRTKCVYGKVARTSEEFDICVPGPALASRDSVTKSPQFQPFQDKRQIRTDAVTIRCSFLGV